MRKLSSRTENAGANAANAREELQLYTVSTKETQVSEKKRFLGAREFCS